jgi:hypothetical protein
MRTAAADVGSRGAKRTWPEDGVRSASDSAPVDRFDLPGESRGASACCLPAPQFFSPPAHWGRAAKISITSEPEIEPKGILFVSSAANNGNAKNSPPGYGD